MKYPLPLLAFAALSSLAGAQSVVSQSDLNARFPLNLVLRRPALADGLMVATALGPPTAHPLPGQPFLVAQPFRVEDSRTLARGTVVEVLSGYDTPSAVRPPLPTGVPVDPRGLPPVGARVLVVAELPQKGALLLPNLLTPEPPNVGTMPTDVPDEALGEAIFPTTQARLYQDPDPKWRLLGSLAAAIPGTPDLNAREITRMIGSSPDRAPYPAGGPDDRFSLLFAGAVAKDTAYHRALVDFALNKNRYWGYGDRFRRDLRAAADDPNAFPDGLPYLPFEENPGNNNMLPRGFHHDSPLSDVDILALLSHAKNPAIASGLLHGLDAKPSDADIHSLARFLDSPDPRLRWAFAERLAWWYGYAPPQRPVESTDPQTNERRVASNADLDAVVAMWKRRFASGTLSP